ncbi:MAG TPA: protein translocase subunit SecF [Gemmatimonadaceae bacterium]|nr:protein translocase subunit SecF [Gemmatimonadaceae bacterium]
MLRILHDTHIDFIRLWKPAALLMVAFIVPALILIPLQGFNYSIEFTGGTVLEVRFKQAPNIAEVRSTLTQRGLPNAEILQFGAPEEIVIRAQQSQEIAQQVAGAQAVADRIKTALDERYGANAYEEVRREAVGPRIGGELRRQATIALLIAFALTLVYLAWRFEWRFSIAAVLATLHDIVATLAFMKYMNLEISVFVVGAILTVIGYSMNDKVVVFDRVRENLKTAKKERLYDLLNRSVNETLPRTVMTGSTTLACLLALLIFGGEVIRPFAWIMTFGILIGTFSSIYVAAPILLWIERKFPRDPGGKQVAAAPQTRAESKAEREKRPSPALR